MQSKGECLNIDTYAQSAKSELATCDSLERLSQWHHQHLSRQGQLTGLKRQIGTIPPEERKAFGQSINALANELESAFYAQQERLRTRQRQAQWRESAVDMTLPSPALVSGLGHPVKNMLTQIIDIFRQWGFEVSESPEIDSDALCFQALNIPPDHPARDMQDTFYLNNGQVLRPHTSPGQIYAMRAHAGKPFRAILPGVCYRQEDITPRSDIQFHQIEGLWIAEDLSLAHLKGLLTAFAQTLFGESQAVRFRGSYFPFTEPSVEVDIRCTLCDAKGCRLCKHTGWLELLGAGMVHPEVLKSGGYDPETMQGLAFGLGVERVVLLQHQIDDIRHFCQNDIHFLTQF